MDLDLSPCPSQGRRMTTNDNIEWRISDGLVLYPKALADMEERAAAIRNEHARERIWLLEHPPLYTAGTSANDAELLAKRFPVYEAGRGGRSEEHTSELQSLMRISYAVLCLQKHIKY